MFLILKLQKRNIHSVSVYDHHGEVAHEYNMENCCSIDFVLYGKQTSLNFFVYDCTFSLLHG